MPTVIRHIDPVSQPQGSNLCWAAVIAMITGRHSSHVIDEITAEARARGVPLDSANRLDESTGVPSLARAYGLSHHRFPLQSVLAGTELSTRLRRRPLGLFGTLTSPPAGGTPRHAVAIHGVTGDFTASSTCTSLGVDPRGFSAINMTFFTLQNQFNIEWIVWRA
jgi:hypothetical protein